MLRFCAQSVTIRPAEIKRFPFPGSVSRFFGGWYTVRMFVLPLTALPFFAQVNRFVVAYSGGLDSHVLLHAAAAMRERLEGRELVALHVNHGLSARADDWSAHCAAQCEALGVALVDRRVDATPRPGESPEATARALRYQAFAASMRAGDCLLTAHHQDDQAETLLIQLLRGAGPRGLAAMPEYSAFAEGWHARPLLGYARDALQEVARQAGLSWIDDESNSDTRFERNFLRHEILPRLKSRYPAAASTLSRAARLCGEAADLLVTTAREDLALVRGGGKEGAKEGVKEDKEEGALSVSGLQVLGEVRARNLLHQWCRDRGLPTPSAAQLQCIWDEVVGAGVDSEPVVGWVGGEARRYRDALFFDRPLPAHDASRCLPWDGRQRLSIPAAGSGGLMGELLGELYAEPVQGQGIALAVLGQRWLEIRFRQGGEQLRPAGRAGHHALKKLFQEAGIPPWRRDRIPLLYADGQLLAVAGLWVAQEAAAAADEPGLVLRWTARG